MAQNIKYKNANYLSLTVPEGTKSGDPVAVGGLHGVAETDEGGGFNPAGKASVTLVGGIDLSVDGKTDAGAPVFLADGKLTATDPADGTAPFGHALEAKPTGTGIVTVRLAN